MPSVEPAKTRLMGRDSSMGSQAVIGESRGLMSSLLALSSPQFGAFLQELGACDSCDAHDRGHLPRHWSQIFGAADEDSYVLAASDTTSATPTSTHLDHVNSLRYRSGTSSNMLHSMSPTTPGLQGLPHPFASPNSTHTRGFKRSASSDDDENGDGDTRPSSSSRRNTAVKRACNECRQQKVSHDLSRDTVAVRHARAQRRGRCRVCVHPLRRAHRPCWAEAMMAHQPA